MSSRSITDLVPELQARYIEFAASMATQNVSFIVTCTYRSQVEQDEAWAQGRTIPGKKVTWTRHSKHTERKAFDVAVLRAGKITWNPADYDAVGVAAKAAGLEWGGNWQKPDRPHVQLVEV